MKKQLSYYVKKLEEAGIDTSVFNLEKNGVVLKVDDLISGNSIVGNYTVSTSSDDLRKYALLFLRMYKATTTNHKKGIEEKGFNAYVRNALSYDYQFTFILEGLKLRGDERKIFDSLFNKDMLVNFLSSYIDRYHQQNKSVTVFDLYEQVQNMKKLDNRDFFYAFKSFASERKQLYFETAKFSLWKDAYKGFLSACAYQYLKNKNLLQTDMTIEELCEEFKGSAWAIYGKLETDCLACGIDLNNVDLESI